MDDYIMGETLHKWGIGKILNKIYCSTGKNKLSEITNPAKNLLIGLNFDP